MKKWEIRHVAQEVLPWLVYEDGKLVARMPSRARAEDALMGFGGKEEENNGLENR